MPGKITVPELRARKATETDELQQAWTHRLFVAAANTNSVYMTLNRPQYAAGIGLLNVVLELGLFGLALTLVVFGAVVFVLINLLVDLLYGILDPRIRDGVA